MFQQKNPCLAFSINAFKTPSINPNSSSRQMPRPELVNDHGGFGSFTTKNLFALGGDVTRNDNLVQTVSSFFRQGEFVDTSLWARESLLFHLGRFLSLLVAFSLNHHHESD
jgi:hypothetical protein